MKKKKKKKKKTESVLENETYLGFWDSDVSVFDTQKIRVLINMRN